MMKTTSGMQREKPLAERDGEEEDVEEGGGGRCSPNNTCVVCMDAKAEDDPRLVCVHNDVFCKTCVSNCLRHGRFSCPLCNTDMKLEIVQGLAEAAAAQQTEGGQENRSETVPRRLSRLSLFHQHLRVVSVIFFAYAFLEFAAVFVRLLAKIANQQN